MTASVSAPRTTRAHQGTRRAHHPSGPARRPDNGIEISLLGGFSLRSERGETPVLPLGVQKVICFLALARRPRLRSYVAGRLWTEFSEDRARANLRAAVWKANRLGSVIAASSDHLRIADGVRVDYWSALDVVAQGEIDASGDDGPERLALLKDDLMPEWPDDWLTDERERFSVLRVRSLECASRNARRRGHRDVAVLTALDAVAADPYSEAARTALMEAYIAGGNLGRARAAYQRYEEMLVEDLGVPPSNAIRRLLATEGIRTTAEEQL